MTRPRDCAGSFAGEGALSFSRRTRYLRNRRNRCDGSHFGSPKLVVDLGRCGPESAEVRRTFRKPYQDGPWFSARSRIAVNAVNNPILNNSFQFFEKFSRTSTSRCRRRTVKISSYDENKNMTTLHLRKSIGWSPLRLGFLLIPLAWLGELLSNRSRRATPCIV
jgi:hypothetical protein